MNGKKTSIFATGVAMGLLVAGTAAADEPNDGGVADPPRGTYVRVDLDPSRVLTGDDDPQLGGAPHILFLNRCAGGVVISPGGGGSIANQSGILGSSVNFPPFPYGDTAWSDVVDRTRAIFSPFNILVTDVDPGNVSHDEAIVCGDGAAAGFSGAGGVAPFTCGIINNPITFTFAQTLGNNPQLIAEVIGQEAAHAWGLDHEFLCEDPMTYLSGCGPKTFQDVNAQCGEYNARSCDCGGATQNSYQHIMDAFGSATPDTQSPTASITYPNDGDVFTPGAAFDITVDVNDDVQVTLVTLFVDGSVEGADETAPFGPWPVSGIPEGTYDFHIEAEDPAGNVTVSPVVTIHVTPDGGPPPPANDDGDPPADSDGGGGDTGGGSDGGNDGVSGDGGGPSNADPDALPPGYGTGFDPAQSSACECSTGGSPQGGLGFGLLLLGLLGLRAQGRRRLH